MNPSFQIDVISRQDRLTIATRTLTSISTEVLSLQNVTSAQVNIVLVDDAEIHRINRQFLAHDESTDVITFFYPAAISSGQSDKDSSEREFSIHGEIVVSVETAQRVAQNEGWNAEDEVALYLVHGLLHLCGYDDLTDSDRQEMRQQERLMMSHVGLPPRSGEDWSHR